MSVCTAGACVLRGCGDGYREPGPTPAREGCDDGNLDDGDACSSSCEPTEVRVYQHPDDGVYATVTERGPAVGVDGDGNVLVVWADDSVASIDMTPGDVAARRYTATGVPVPLAGMDPLVIDSAYPTNPVAPRVAGLASGGWAVVWHRGRQVWTRVVRADGSMTAIRQVSSGAGVLSEHDPSVAALADGYVVVWVSDASSTFATDPYGGVRARLYTSSGSARAAEFPVPTDRSTRESWPMVASDGDAWMVVWTQAPTGGTASARARRYDGATARDATELTLTSDEAVRTNVASLGAGTFVTTWESGPDLHARVIAPGPLPSDESDILLVATGTGYRDTVPAAYPDASGNFLVLYATDSRTGYDIATSPGATLPMVETMALRALLAGGEVLESGASAVTTPAGVWFVWSRDAGGLPEVRSWVSGVK